MGSRRLLLFLISQKNYKGTESSVGIQQLPVPGYFYLKAWVQVWEAVWKTWDVKKDIVRPESKIKQNLPY